MKVRCDKIELSDCLNDVLGIIPAAQSVKPIFQDFHLKTDGGCLLVEATDLDMAARMRLERVEVMEDGEIAVPAVRLHSLLREIPDKNILIESIPNSRGAWLRASGYEFKMLGEDPAEFPESPEFHREGALEASRERFIEMLRRVSVAASRDTTRFQLTGVFFEVEDDRLTLTATDGKRLTNDHMRIGNPKGISASAIVPNRVIDVLSKVLAQGPDEFCFNLGDPNFQAGFGRGELTAKVIQGTYPDYRAALPSQVNFRVTGKKTDFLSAAKSAALMTDRETATVLFRFEDAKACLSTQATEIGESRIEIPIALEGSTFEVRYNPAYLIDALRCLSEEEVRIEFVDPDRPGAVRSGQHYRHLVMPLVVAKS